MDYIAVITENGTLPTATPDGWRVVPTPSDLPAVRRALLHGAIPLVGAGSRWRRSNVLPGWTWRARLRKRVRIGCRTIRSIS